ncbi:MAG: nucleoside triphosphate pyrophosphohydrolase [Patescibacteria group bacterium]|nr:nucleoside triphosphate pyrophosphohydrolase [bacterium]MDZ4240755.1 nucleoside triphosphate pyrophosphohydrolase [Patescibacteria group bacterium]
MKYNKLVRDNIPEHIKNKGEMALTHIADDKEYWLKLKEKLSEEVKEFFGNESIEEMADILEVIEAINTFKDFNGKELSQVKEKKAAEKGKFQKRIILDES